jgi:3',5'-cyclic AMP phosphodiesterase CpdA
MRHRLLLALIALAAAAAGPVAVESSLPNRPDSVKFAVIGDNGTGDRPQYEVGARMALARQSFPFDLVLMLGDNFYGSQRPQDLVKKFELPYKPLLEAGVVFQAAIGNHDDPSTVNYPPLNMKGRRYYDFTRGPVRFFVLDTNNLDAKQVAWFREALAASTDSWKIAYFHHPLYSNAGRHGSAVDLRVILEPLLVQHGVSVVFSGHDHSYERLEPQKGITYFVAGSGGKLRKGDIEPSDQTARAFDEDQAFVLVEIAGPELFFETISRSGTTVDSGVIANRNVSRLTESAGLAGREMATDVARRIP